MTETRDRPVETKTVPTSTWVAFALALGVLVVMTALVVVTTVTDSSYTVLAVAVAFFVYATNSTLFSRALRGPFLAPEPIEDVVDRAPLFEISV